MSTPRLPVVEWTDAPAGLNRLVRFAERRNLVSARVPSHFKRSLPYQNADGRFYCITWRGCHLEKIWLNFVTVKSWRLSESGRSKPRIFQHPWKLLSCSQYTYV
jgi:hypothetical protein